MEATTVHQIQAVVRGRRKDLGLSQTTLARKAGTSRKWLSEFERGTTAAVELPLVLRVVTALDLAVTITAIRTTSAEPPRAPKQDMELDLDEVLRNYASRGHR